MLPTEVIGEAFTMPRICLIFAAFVVSCSDPSPPNADADDDSGPDADGSLDADEDVGADGDGDVDADSGDADDDADADTLDDGDADDDGLAPEPIEAPELE